MVEPPLPLSTTSQNPLSTGTSTPRPEFIDWSAARVQVKRLPPGMSSLPIWRTTSRCGMPEDSWSLPHTVGVPGYRLALHDRRKVEVVVGELAEQVMKRTGLDGPVHSARTGRTPWASGSLARKNTQPLSWSSSSQPAKAMFETKSRAYTMTPDGPTQHGVRPLLRDPAGLGHERIDHAIQQPFQASLVREAHGHASDEVEAPRRPRTSPGTAGAQADLGESRMHAVQRTPTAVLREVLPTEIGQGHRGPEPTGAEPVSRGPCARPAHQPQGQTPNRIDTQDVGRRRVGFQPAPSCARTRAWARFTESTPSRSM